MFNAFHGIILERNTHYRTSSISFSSPPVRLMFPASPSAWAVPSPSTLRSTFPHYRRYPMGGGVALALGCANPPPSPPAPTVAVALALALALALSSAFSCAVLPKSSSMPLFSSQMTAITPAAMTMPSTIQKSQQIRVRRFFLDCWRASQDSLGHGLVGGDWG